MSTTSKSPRRVLLKAYAVAKDALPAYTHPCSPKKFTQPQLFACLVAKEFFKTDYRGIAAILHDTPNLCEAIELQAVPHFTTLQKAAARLTRKAPIDHLLNATIAHALRGGILDETVDLAAIDATGLESHHVSRHFIRRRERGKNLYQTTTYRRFPKLGAVCDCRSHLILSAVPGRGPGSDLRHYEQALREAVARMPINTLLADAGYDSEASHVLAREIYGTHTIIPNKIGRPTSKPPSGPYRREMSESFDKETYGQRWQVETAFSMLKRNLGSALRARAYWAQCRESMLRVITHNVMILYALAKVFYRACQEPFSQADRRAE
jgi:transposase